LLLTSLIFVRAYFFQSFPEMHQSPFRRDLRVDVHTHILPPSWQDMKARSGYGGWVTLRHCAGDAARATMFRDDGTLFRAVEDNLWSVERRLRDCDAVGVDVHVLSTVPVMFSYWARAEDALALSEELNDHVARCVAAHPTRLVGLGTLPMQSPRLAIQELRRCKFELGLKGVQIGSHIETNRSPVGGDGSRAASRAGSAAGTGASSPASIGAYSLPFPSEDEKEEEWPLSEPRLFPVFREAAELGMAVFVHPWDMMGAGLMKKYFLPWLVGMPAETSLAICSMIFGGIFERLPNLRVCFAHGGGSFPGTLGRVQHGFDVRPDLCAVDCAMSPVAHMGRFWADSLVHDPLALETVVSVFGEDRVCLGTDYPFPLGEYTAESRGKDYCAGRLIDEMGIEGVDNGSGCEREIEDETEGSERGCEQGEPHTPFGNGVSTKESVPCKSSRRLLYSCARPAVADAIIWGSGHFKAKGWSHSRRRKILGTNALDWLNLELETFLRK
jgi:aminocarboxymuconate-semialdehyde decarboxylase